MPSQIGSAPQVHRFAIATQMLAWPSNTSRGFEPFFLLRLGIHARDRAAVHLYSCARGAGSERGKLSVESYFVARPKGSSLLVCEDIRWSKERDPDGHRTHLPSRLVFILPDFLNRFDGHFETEYTSFVLFRGP